jgi:hypothetical protein
MNCDFIIVSALVINNRICARSFQTDYFLL